MKKRVLLSLIGCSVLLAWYLKVVAAPAPVASAVAEDEEAVVSPLPPGAKIVKSDANKNDFYVLGQGESKPQEVYHPPTNHGFASSANPASPQSDNQQKINDDMTANVRESPGDKEANHLGDPENPKNDKQPLASLGDNFKSAPVDEADPSDEVRLENQAMSQGGMQQSASNAHPEEVEVIPHSEVHKWERHHKA